MNGVARFIRQFAQEYSIVQGLQAHLLRDREEAVQRFQNLPLGPTKFRIAMCMLGNPRSEAVALTNSTFTEVKNTDHMPEQVSREEVNCQIREMSYIFWCFISPLP